jgi:cardiolipin synthase
MFEDLRRAGVQVIEFNPIAPWKRRFRLSRLTRRDHRKILITDGVTGFTGGINIADFWLPLEEDGAGWRDDMVRIDGPAVADLSACFALSWKRLRGAPLRVVGYAAAPLARVAAVQAVRVLGQHFLRTQRQISRAYLHYVQRAQVRVFIANSYFVPDGRILRALSRAARRGVDVRIIVPGQSDVDIVRHASRAVWGRLLRAGVRIFEWDESVLHAKSAVIDGRWSTTGTFNFDYLSLRMNLEVNVSVLDARFAARLQASFLEDFEQCREVRLVDFRFRPLGQRLLELIAYRLRKFL